MKIEPQYVYVKARLIGEIGISVLLATKSERQFTVYRSDIRRIKAESRRRDRGAR